MLCTAMHRDQEIVGNQVQRLQRHFIHVEPAGSDMREQWTCLAGALPSLGSAQQQVRSLLAPPPPAFQSLFKKMISIMSWPAQHAEDWPVHRIWCALVRSAMTSHQRRGDSDAVAHCLYQLLALDLHAPEWDAML